MLIVPDIHGRDFWKEPVHDALGKEHILFLGDYLDPYGYEGISATEAYARFREILGLKKEHPDEVTLLLGNHDLHYVDGRMVGSRYDFTRGGMIQRDIISNANLFQIAHETEMAGRKFLFTHAGILRGWLLSRRNILGDVQAGREGATLNALWWDGDMRFRLLTALNAIPRERGGDSLFGSPVWADVEEWADDEEYELPGIYQVFGHSQQEEDPVIGEHFACLDCRKVFRLDLAEGTAAKMRFTSP